MKLERRDIGLREVKLDGEGDEAGRFSGYGAIFGNIDSYGDVIARGAFEESLGEWRQRGKWPPMLLQHGGMGIGAEDQLPIGQWTNMEENRRGLKVEGRLFAMNTERGQYVYEGIKSGVLDGLSIGFEVREARNGTKPDEPDRTLTNINLWEVSIVTFPANDLARIAAVKALTPTKLRELEGLLGERGLSRRDREIAATAFKQWLQSGVAAPDNTLREEDVPDSGWTDAEAAAHATLAKFCGGLLRIPRTT